ncbi:MAG TPA: putative molybdenum carrier protein [Gammaproteobacteria bacterium]|nr:putative molybdenum carrier protein [Gammaproteobacteria bacterium]
MIDRVVSGGQTGVDRAALDAAIHAGLDCGGWCPRGRRAEDGAIPHRYRLKETGSTDYRGRTRRNVTDSNGTLILVLGELSGGTELTRDLALAERKPLFVIDLDSPRPSSEVRGWIRDNHIRTLNVAGPRESQRPGIAVRAADYLSGLFSELKAGAGNSGLRAKRDSKQDPAHE